MIKVITTRMKSVHKKSMPKCQKNSTKITEPHIQRPTFIYQFSFYLWISMLEREVDVFTPLNLPSNILL